MPPPAAARRGQGRQETHEELRISLPNNSQIKPFFEKRHLDF
jgi:hypothetical protein